MLTSNNTKGEEGLLSRLRTSMRMGAVTRISCATASHSFAALLYVLSAENSLGVTTREFAVTLTTPLYGATSEITIEEDDVEVGCS